MLIIAVFYLISSISDIVCIRMTFNAFTDQNLLCINERFILSANNQGARILLLYTLVTYLNSLVMLYVFYYLPSQSGLAVPAVTVIQLDED